MPTFKYEAKQPGVKKTIKSEIDGVSKEEAEKSLVLKGLVPVSVKEKSSGSKFSLGSRISTKEKVLFSRQMSTLINAGLPLVQSLKTVEGQTKNAKMSSYISDIINSVEGGATLADSMGKHNELFSDVYISLVAAGEVSGSLDDTLKRIANQQEKDAEITRKVRGAMIYPLIVLVVVFAVLIFMTVGVLPMVGTLYEDTDKDLPTVTVAMLSVSSFMSSYWWTLIVALVGFIVLMRGWTKTPGGRRGWDKFKITMPVIKRLMNKLYMARFSRTMQTLMASSVPMLKSLGITKTAVGNVIIGDGVERVASKVKTGERMSAALEHESELFLPLVYQMANVGETSGNIDEMMGKAADYFESELDEEIKALSTIIEPALLVLLAIVAGGMIAAVFLPIYGLIGENFG